MAERSRRRTLIGSSTDVGSWQRVYETAEAVEVDEASAFVGTRRRVFYDEVLLVTRHSFIGWALAALLALVALPAGLGALIAALSGSVRATVNFALLTLVPVVLLGLRLFIKVEAVTVHGRRSRARVCFWLRKRRGKETFQRLCARVRHAQERAAREGTTAREREEGLGPPPRPPGESEVAS
jgi:hypothetical protein